MSKPINQERIRIAARVLQTEYMPVTVKALSEMTGYNHSRLFNFVNNRSDLKKHIGVTMPSLVKKKPA
ncbi:MAG: hypothetical protein JWO43_529 [Candidatus Adlerbacteria bacterium]|nr:hypothetical protein [Candidatus Adlerbacteria bacterium]